jgi:hypothetical protein
MHSIETSNKLKPKPGGVKQLSMSSLKSHSQHNNQTSSRSHIQEGSFRDEKSTVISEPKMTDDPDREKNLRLKKMSIELETEKIKHVKMFRSEVKI